MSRPLEFNTFQAADIMEWYKSALVDHETDCNTVERPKAFKQKDRENRYKSVYTYLDKFFNARVTPLTYVFLKGNRTEDYVITMDEEIVWNDPLQKPELNIDSKTVLIFLKELWNGKNNKTWIKGTRCGRSVMPALQ